jgi:WD40 repeat protein
VTASDDGSARIWEAKGEAPLFTLKDHKEIDGRRIVTASDEKTARVWETATGSLLLTLKGHDDFVRSAAFSADGRRIITASGDRTVRIWDSETGEQILVINGPRLFRDAVFSPDGRIVASGSDDGSVAPWDARSVMNSPPEAPGEHYRQANATNATSCVLSYAPEIKQGRTARECGATLKVIHPQCSGPTRSMA